MLEQSATRPWALRVALISTLLGALLVHAGCTAMWDRVRERERTFALETGRTQTQRGQCAGGLKSLDRAEARLDIGIYAREATSARIRCYEKLGLQELAAAHRRMLNDFYTNEPMALPEADGSSIFRVTNLEATDFERPPSWLKISQPRYSPYAQRSKIVGRVVVAFELARNGTPKQIRVLEMPHPLLATWAIEAVASAEKKQPRDAPEIVVVPGDTYLTTFSFEWRWANVDEEDEYEDEYDRAR